MVYYIFVYLNWKLEVLLCDMQTKTCQKLYVVHLDFNPTYRLLQQELIAKVVILRSVSFEGA